MTDYRAVFDAVVEFTNGGSLSVQGFRVDVPSPYVDPDTVAELFVGSLGLLMTGSVTISDLQIVDEPHRGTRGAAGDSAGAAAGGAGTAARWANLSHVIRDGMVTFPGLPGPTITQHLTREASRSSYAPGTEFAIDRISMVGNTGTYIDAPLHRFADGDDLSELRLDRLAGLPAVIVRIAGTPQRAVDRLTLAPLGDLRGAAVLIHSGDSALFGTSDYAKDAAHLTGDGADYLVRAGAALVGIDSISIDDLSDLSRPAHTVLLRAGIPIVEHLTGLDQLPPRGAVFSAVPPMVASVGAFPVRAYAQLPA
jgi:arylformamidase